MLLLTPGRPYPVENCDLSNATGSYVVSCRPGFDGGLTQTFNLEVGLSVEVSKKFREKWSSKTLNHLMGVPI